MVPRSPVGAPSRARASGSTPDLRFGHGVGLEEVRHVRRFREDGRAIVPSGPRRFDEQVRPRRIGGVLRKGQSFGDERPQESDVAL